MLIGANLILNDTTLPMDVVAPAVEAHGLDAIFIGEHTHTPVATVHPAYPEGLPEFYKRFMDPFVQLAVAAAVTDRIRLGTGVILVAERNPLELAKSIASLDHVSRGRVEMGVGYGWNPLEMLNNGVDPRARRAVFREKLTAVRRLWQDDVADYDGDHVHFSPSWSFPKPLQQPHPPVLIGAAASSATFADVAELAEGWYPLASPALNDDLVRLAERCGGRVPLVTVVEMAGQRGVPWYHHDDRAEASLGRAAREYADLGVHRLSVGLPADEPSELHRALEVLGRLAQHVG